MATHLGKRIKRARDGLGMTQLELANAVGVSLRTVGVWEKSGRVPLGRQIALSEVLGENLTAGTDDDSEESGAGGMEVTYDGWRFALHPAPEATPEQVARAEDHLLPLVMQKLRELGLHPPE